MFENKGETDFRAYEKTPLYQKAWKISNLVNYIVESVSKTDIDFEQEAGTEILNHNLQFMQKTQRSFLQKSQGPMGPICRI